MLNDNTHCLICGFDWETPLISNSCSHMICECCGCELNYEYEPDGSTPKEHILNIRNIWLSKGAKWFSKRNEPENWNKEMALAQIKANVPEEFQ